MSKDRKTIIAVDFDGTLCINEYPRIGEPMETMIDFLKLAHSRHDPNSCKIILWTCRTGDLLSEAVNENLPEIVEKFGGDSRKIYADIYIDDRNCNDLHVLYRLIRYGSGISDKQIQAALAYVNWCQ